MRRSRLHHCAKVLFCSHFLFRSTKALSAKHSSRRGGQFSCDVQWNYQSRVEIILTKPTFRPQRRNPNWKIYTGIFFRPVRTPKIFELIQKSIFHAGKANLENHLKPFKNFFRVGPPLALPMQPTNSPFRFFRVPSPKKNVQSPKFRITETRVASLERKTAVRNELMALRNCIISRQNYNPPIPHFSIQVEFISRPGGVVI